jgi:hypothetical protein
MSATFVWKIRHAQHTLRKIVGSTSTIWPSARSALVRMKTAAASRDTRMMLRIGSKAFLRPCVHPIASETASICEAFDLEVCCPFRSIPSVQGSSLTLRQRHHSQALSINPGRPTSIVCKDSKSSRVRNCLLRLLRPFWQESNCTALNRLRSLGPRQQMSTLGHSTFRSS